MGDGIECVYCDGKHLSESCPTRSFTTSNVLALVKAARVAQECNAADCTGCSEDLAETLAPFKEIQ